MIAQIMVSVSASTIGLKTKINISSSLQDCNSWFKRSCIHNLSVFYNLCVTAISTVGINTNPVIVIIIFHSEMNSSALVILISFSNSKCWSIIGRNKATNCLKNSRFPRIIRTNDESQSTSRLSLRKREFHSLRLSETAQTCNFQAFNRHDHAPVFL